MHGQQFAHSWTPAIAIMSLAGGLGYVGISWLLRPLSQGTELQQIALDVFLILTGSYFLWVVLRDVLTVIGDEGVSRRTVLGWRFYPWRELRRIDSRGYAGRLVFSDGAIWINLLLYKNGSDVAAFIRTKMPEDAPVNFIGGRPVPPKGSQ